ncbi:MAG: glycosyltransferase [Nitrospira sp.]|nr:glycosyltransferase [Nitrospira sp.]
MNIAQIGPFHEAVSLQSEGPEGRMIALLTRELLRLGHEVTVFASGDSRTAGRLVSVAPLAMRAYPMPKRHLADALAMLALEKAFAMAPAFDMIHVHAGSVAFPLMRRSAIPIVATVYGPVDAPEVLRLHREFRELVLVATSAEQVQQAPDLNWQAVIPSDSSRGEAVHQDLSARITQAYESVYEWRTLGRPADRRNHALALCQEA